MGSRNRFLTKEQREARAAANKAKKDAAAKAKADKPYVSPYERKHGKKQDHIIAQEKKKSEALKAQKGSGKRAQQARNDARHAEILRKRRERKRRALQEAAFNKRKRT